MATTQYNIFGSSVPASSVASDSGALNLGVQFQSDYAGQITAIRFYKPAGLTGTLTGTLYNESGVELGSGTRAGDSTTGWVTITLSSPVNISGGYYTASVFCANFTNYYPDASYLRSSNLPVPKLSYPLLVSGWVDPTSDVGGNTPESFTSSGVFTYGTRQVPTNTSNGTNYWVDVVLSADPAQYSSATVPSIRSTSVAAYSSRTNSSVAKPVGVASGDLVILIFASYGLTADPVSQNGLTQLGSTVTKNDGTKNFEYRVYYKFATASEPTNYVFTHAKVNTELVCHAIQNVKPSAVPTIVNQIASTADGSTARRFVNRLNTASDNSLLLAFEFDYDLLSVSTVPNNSVTSFTRLAGTGATQTPEWTGIKSAAGSAGYAGIPVTNQGTAYDLVGLIAIEAPTPSGPAAQTISGASVGSFSATFGTPTINPGAVSVQPSGITATATFGTPTVSVGGATQTVQPQSITASATFGSPSVIPGAVTISPTGIQAAVTFGVPTVVPGVRVITISSGIAITASFGTPTVVAGASAIVPASIVIAPSFGAPQILPGPVSVTPGSILATPAFGTPTVNTITTISPAGLAITPLFGVPALHAGPVSVSPDSILVSAIVGQPLVIGGQADQAFTVDRKTYSLQLEDLATFALAIEDIANLTLAYVDDKVVTLPAINMTKTNSTLQPIAIGNYRRIHRTYPMPAGLVISKAWFTIKAKDTTADVDALVFREVNLAFQQGVGQIVHGDSSTGAIELIFDITPDRSILAKAGVTYLFEIKALRDNGEPHTLEQGTVPFFKDIIGANS